jgi:hypothetical protein
LTNISFNFTFIDVMKKFFTIPLALLILLSGMHFTIATHFCGGEVAATKVSLSGKAATCGMVSNVRSKHTSEASFNSDCCENEFSIYSTDNNYSPSEFHVKEITQNVLHVFYIPESFSFHSDYPLLTNFTNVSPPDNFGANAVSMANICVFRI